MKKLLLAACAAFAVAGGAIAQDIHQTQYWSSPLTLNPALTGLVRCDMRVTANYRNQWASVSSNPYTTAVISYDVATLKGKLPEGDALGVGVIGYYDKSGTGALTNTSFGLSLAYHKSFGSEKQHIISVGAQGMYTQKTINFSKLTFEDQFDPSTGTTVTTTGEVFGNRDLSYPDYNVGIMYSGKISEHTTAYVGGSAYHLTEPTETFMNGDAKIHRRYSGYLGGSFDLNENMVLYASALYQSQASASEILGGAAAGFILNPGADPEYTDHTILYLGTWYRYGDALSPYVGLEWTKMTIGISYDVNLSNFTPATSGQGAYEISATFNGCINKRDRGPKYNFSCPKF